MSDRVLACLSSVTTTTIHSSRRDDHDAQLRTVALSLARSLAHRQHLLLAGWLAGWLTHKLT